MKYFFDKTRLAVSATVGSLVIVLAVAAPQAWANGASGVDDASARALEQKMKLLEDQLRAIQNEMDQVKSDAAKEVQHVKEVEEMAAHADEVAMSAARKSRMIFFRGGFTHAMQGRHGSSITSNVVPVGAQDTADQNGWYIGAGVDFGLTDDLWGYLPKTSVAGEIMFEYKEFANDVKGNALANIPTQLAGGTLNPRDVTVSQFTLTAAPKIRFMEGSKFRPWIIPAGLAIHVISPASESITYVSPGVMFGAGIEYNIWKDIFLGIDGRYHLTAGKADGVKVDGMTAGGYLGIGF
jgi:opacity protein-like surface antigen